MTGTAGGGEGRAQPPAALDGAPRGERPARPCASATATTGRRTARRKPGRPSRRGG